MDSDLHLSVVVPVFNDEVFVREAVRRIGAYFDFIERPGEILVSDDGSTDRTVEYLNDAPHGSHASLRVLTLEPGAPRGFAARRGVLEARGRAVLVTEAALPTPVKEVEKLLAALGAGADAAFGARSEAGRKGGLFGAIAQAVVLPGIRDGRCAFRLFSARAAQEIFPRLTLPEPAGGIEMLYVARKLGLKAVEVPVMWAPPAGIPAPVNRLRDLLWVKQTHG